MTSVQLWVSANAKIRSEFTDGERRAIMCSLAASVTSTYHSINAISIFRCSDSPSTYVEEGTQVLPHLL